MTIHLPSRQPAQSEEETLRPSSIRPGFVKSSLSSLFEGLLVFFPQDNRQEVKGEGNGSVTVMFSSLVLQAS